MSDRRTVYLLVCAAPPAGDALIFAKHAVEAGWDCHVIGTPAAEGFINTDELENATSNPVTFQHRQPRQPRRGRPPADALVIAPATANTINQLAAGLGSNYALDVASELIGLGVPTVILPFANEALTARAPFKRAASSLRDEGVKILFDEAGCRPHPPHCQSYRAEFPWKAAFTTVEQQVARASGKPRVE